MLTEAITRHCKKHKYSDSYRDYWIAHQLCEICDYFADPPHHIRTRGAGGSDEASNLLSLCTAHHREAHTIGMLTFGEKYLDMREKIYRALELELPEW